MTFKIVAFIISVSFYCSSNAQKTKVILDADTGCEVDDQYAIVRALMEESFEVLALCSSQYHTQGGAPKSSVEISQEWNEKILRLMNLESIPSPQGAYEPLMNSHSPQISPASEKIIELANELKSGEKIEVFTFGPLTNVASAILVDPGIVSKISLNMMGLNFNPESQKWGYDFNCKNDTVALNLILDTKDLELKVMTSSTSVNLVFKKEDVDKSMKGKPGIFNVLVERWDEYIKTMTWTPPVLPSSKFWVMWDIAIVEAFVNPEFATLIEVDTPPENFQRKIWVYTNIDPEAMQNDYFLTVKEYLK